MGQSRKMTWNSPENDMGQSRTQDGTAQQHCVLTSTMLLVPPPYGHRDWSIISPKTSLGFFLFLFPNTFICKEHDLQNEMAEMHSIL